jgi:hypothetical protein
MRVWIFVAAIAAVLMLGNVDVISDSDIEEETARVSAKQATFVDHVSDSDDGESREHNIEHAQPQVQQTSEHLQNPGVRARNLSASEQMARDNWLKVHRRAVKAQNETSLREWAANPGDPQLQDAFLRACLTKEAKKQFGEVAATVQKASFHDRFVTAMKDLFLALGHGGNSLYRSSLLSYIAKAGKLATSYFVENLQIPAGYVNSANFKRRQDESKHAPDPLLDAKHSVIKQQARPINTTFDIEVLKFFDDETLELSGSRNGTRVLPISKTALRRVFYGKFPALVRAMTLRNGGIDAILAGVNPGDMLTDVQAHALAAHRVAIEEGWTPKTEEAQRLLAWDIHHLTELQFNAVRRKTGYYGATAPTSSAPTSTDSVIGPHFVVGRQARQTLSDFQHLAWEIKPM